MVRSLHELTSLVVGMVKGDALFVGADRTGVDTSCASCFISDRKRSISDIVHLIKA